MYLLGLRRADFCPRRSYESLSPNFSLLQNMAAGAFAGIAVSDQPQCPSDDLDAYLRSGCLISKS